MPSTGSVPRVLVVLSSNARRGAEIEGSRLADELATQGLTAEVFALAPAPAAAARLDVAVFGRRPLGFGTLRTLRRRARAADVVVAYGSSTLPACAIALVGTGVPFVYRSIGDPRHWVRGRLHRARTALLMRRAARVVALYYDAASAICELYGVAPDRVAVIPNARSASEFRPPTAGERIVARQQLALSADGPVVAIVGALTPEKRVDLAIRAVSLVEGFTLLVAGDGPQRGELEQLGRNDLGDRVRFLGVLADVTPVYCAADVVLLSSSTEGMPGTAIEAGMSGVPVAACEVGAMSWLFDHGLRGALCSVDATPQQFADTIEAAKAIGTPCDVLQACQWDAFIDAWRAELHRVMNG